MSLALLLRTWRAQWLKLLAVMAALGLWGFLMPVIYSTFGSDVRRLFGQGEIPEQFARFGGGDVFSLPGAIALGYIHPLAVAVICVFAVGFAAAAVAGERQRGTLEVLLARPLSRRTVYVTLLVATFAFVALAVASLIVGALVSSVLWNVIGELETRNLPALWLNGTLLFMAFGTIGLAASVSFDRLTPALAVTLAITIVSYFLEVLGSLWPDAEPLQPYSLFHYLRAKDVLAGQVEPFNLALLAAVVVVAVVYALVAFPRRDLAAPS
jgi:ABC-2 type transport system permease protein